MEALLPPIAAPAAIPSPEPENTRESDSGVLMFDSCEFVMAAALMAIRNFRTQRQDATADNLSGLGLDNKSSPLGLLIALRLTRPSTR